LLSLISWVNRTFRKKGKEYFSHAHRSIEQIQTFETVLTTLEAHLVKFQASCDSLLCSIHRLATFGALGVFHRLERHIVGWGLLS
jgi:hypothetical protein